MTRRLPILTSPVGLLRKTWSIRPDTTYLNHGSFGPPPEPCANARLKWVSNLDSQPMDLFVRQLEPAWRAARDQLASLLAHQRIH